MSADGSTLGACSPATPMHMARPHRARRARVAAHRVLRTDPWTDPHTIPLRLAYAEPLATWIAARAPDRPVRLLDLGCADLLSRTWVPATWVVDGWDTSPTARRAARRAIEDRGLAGAVPDDPTELPPAAYDGIVVASIVQYLGDRREVAELMASTARWLKPDAALGAILTDVIIDRVQRVTDLLDAGRHAVQAVGTIRGAEAMVRNAVRSSGARLALGEADIAELAGSAGLRSEVLPANLSPLSSRRTYVLQRDAHPRGTNV